MVKGSLIRLKTRVWRRKMSYDFLVLGISVAIYTYNNVTLSKISARSSRPEQAVDHSL